METITYKLEHFEGPLDLLLHLIEKNKIDIYDIPIVEITAQYLAYVRQMEREDLNIVSDFLVMAATLLDIKAKMLLPKEVNEEGEEIDPRAELVSRLLEYKRYKLLAEELAEREEGALMHFYKASTLPPEVAKYQPPVDLDELLDGMTLAKLKRREPVSLETKIGSVLAYARKKRRFSFRQLLERQSDKLEIVVTFLAVLELMKIGKIHLTQEETFGDMDIEALEPEGMDEEPDLAELRNRKWKTAVSM